MKRIKSKDLDIKNKSIDVRPLNQRESPLSTRKGMPKVKCQGFFDTSDYKEQLLFDNSPGGNFVQPGMSGHSNDLTGPDYCIVGDIA